MEESKQNEKKQRKLRSEVWDEFTKSEAGEDGKEWAICKHCGGKFDGSSKKGTTHLKNHLKSKICQDKRKRDDDDDDGNGDKSTKTRDLVMEEKSFGIDLIKRSFNEDGYVLNPSILNSRKVEILQLYQEKKEKFGEFFNKLSCRFSLHIVGAMFGHLLLIVRYIDDCWERQTKIIGILSAKNYIEEMKESCLALKIDRNVCSIRHDYIIEDADKEVIESWFSQRGSLPFAGIIPDFEAFIREIQILNLKMIIKIDGLWECVDYGYKTSSKLQLAVNIAVTMGKKVICNVCPEHLFEYLEAAVGLKEAFSELEKIDPDFISINLTNQKWDEAIATFEHLKELREFSNSFRRYSCSTTPPIVDILKLFRCTRSKDCHVCKNASYKKLFDKIKVHLFVGVILDPRFKMGILHHWHEENYGSDDADGYLEKTIKDFRDNYNEYAKDSSNNSYKMMDAMGWPCKASAKSELDLYLNDLKVPAVEGFDILAWWRGNAPFYPTLARMARDYLALPIQMMERDIFDLEAIDYIVCSKIDCDILSACIYLYYKMP